MTQGKYGYYIKSLLKIEWPIIQDNKKVVKSIDGNDYAEIGTKSHKYAVNEASEYSVLRESK